MSVSEISGAAAGVVEPQLAPRHAIADGTGDPAALGLRRDETRSWHATVQRALLLADVIALVPAVILGLALASPDYAHASQLQPGVLYLPTFLLLFKLYGLYDGDRHRLAPSTLDDVPGVLHAALIGTLGLWAVLRIGGAEPLSAGQAAAVLTLTSLLVLTVRAVARTAVLRCVAPERILVIGAGPTAALLMRRIRGQAASRLEPAGYLSDDDGTREPPEPGLPRLGGSDDLATICRTHGIERAVIAAPAIEPHHIPRLIRQANEAGIAVTLLPWATEVLGPATELHHVQGLTVLAVSPAQLSRSSRILKRALDVVGAACAVTVLLVLLPLVAVAIKLDSPGPVFFRQKRLGRGGRVFEVIKLRTMVADAEALVPQLQHESAEAAWLRLDRDPRVTRVGRFLRLTSIDELPQLWNVLRGEMSLVGPRPMPLVSGSHIQGWGRRRHDLTPGITGMWQVSGRASLTFEEMLQLDYVYVTNWSVWGDVRLLLRTIAVVLTRRGAN